MVGDNTRSILLYVWQLPQNLLGLLLLAIYKPQRVHVLENGVEIYYSHKMGGGISLGKYCLVNTSHYRENVEDSLARNTVRHEAKTIDGTGLAILDYYRASFNRVGHAVWRCYQGEQERIL